MFSRAGQQSRKWAQYTGDKIPKRVARKPEKGTNDESFVDATDNSPNRKNATSRDVLNDFLECSSVHGIQYFGNLSIKVGPFGKFIWACTMITGFVCLTLMVIQFMRRYYDNPTNTFIKTFYAPISLAPFPAVTICPITKPSLNRRLNIMKNLRIPKNMSEEEATIILKYGTQFANPFEKQRGVYMDIFRALLQENGWSLTDFLKIVLPCEDVADACWWNGEKINCTDSIKYSHTARGMCCSFNYQLEDYIVLKKHEGELPTLYNDMFGPESGLRIVFKKGIMINREPEDNTSRVMPNINGLWIIIHHNAEYPGENVNSRILQTEREVQIGVKPSLYKKPAGLYTVNGEGYTVPICIAPNKGQLKYFPTYRYSNCYANCIIEATLEICGCIPHLYDPIAARYEVPPCGLEGLACIMENANNIRIVKDVQKANFSCSCRTPCENVVYDTIPVTFSITKTEFSPSYVNVRDGQSVVRVFWSAQVFTALETIPAADEIYLLASIGGIFSLFLGCSFLSGVEILYFAGLFYRAIFFRRRSNNNGTSMRKNKELQKKMSDPHFY